MDGYGDMEVGLGWRDGSDESLGLDRESGMFVEMGEGWIGCRVFSSAVLVVLSCSFLST